MKNKPSSQEIPIYACDSLPLTAFVHLEDFLSNATPSPTGMISSKKPKFSLWVCALALVKTFPLFAKFFLWQWQNLNTLPGGPFLLCIPVLPCQQQQWDPHHRTKQSTKKAALYIKPLRTQCMVGGGLARGQRQGRECCAAVDAVPGIFVTHFSLMSPDSNAGVSSYLLYLKMSPLTS